MDITIPTPLLPGDTVAMIGVSGCIHKDPVQQYVDEAEAALRALGFNVRVDETCGRRWGFFAGTDPERAEALNRAFADDEIDGIWCIKGGYGCSRMVELADWDLIAAHPKAFIGYSDITALHTALHQRCHLATFHGPMPIGGIAPSNLPSLMHAISGQPDWELVNIDGSPLVGLHPGTAEGVLVGGNLNLLASGCGTPNELDVRGKLLFLEDVGEYSYHIDGYLQQLFNAGKFSECAGIIFGGFTDCNEEYERSNSFSVDDLLEQIAQRVKVPVIKNLQAGHMKDKLTLCLGRTYRMDADAGRIRLVG